ncbi:MAG: S-methyl-5'-thioadenosine phosphorylase [Thermoplasmatales archaeon]|nr:S-methyl-5'-thioadenosine phosphorylase [Thermoplasmatales archaeon]
MPRIGIIGGSGVYNPDRFELIKKEFPDTPYGKPSGEILVGKINGVEVAFLPRHGGSHGYPPHMIPYRANVWAMKSLGVEIIISPCAVGSLKEDYRPEDMVIVDQFIDFTKGRDYTFFDDRTVHISLPEPFCPSVTKVFADAAREMGIRHHVGGTYVCIEGPRFSTRAESRMFRQHADVIGMTLVPECQLAREAGMCYCSLATITDYDSWKEETVDVQMVFDTMAKCLANITRILEIALPRIESGLEPCSCAEAAESCGAKLG